MCYSVGNENVMDKIHLMATKDKNKIYFYIKITNFRELQTQKSAMCYSMGNENVMDKIHYHCYS